MTWDEFLATPPRDLPWWGQVAVALVVLGAVAAWTQPWRRRLPRT